MPTAQRIAQGRSHSPLPLNEPKPQKVVELPPAPESLEGPAADTWYEYGAKAIRDGVLADTDLAALEALCLARGRMLLLADDVAADGHMENVERCNKDGVVISVKRVVRPEVGLLKDATAEFHRWAREFGWTPAARTRVQVIPEKEGKGKTEEERLLEEMREMEEAQGRGMSQGVGRARGGVM